jgi:hypothetical protein
MLIGGCALAAYGQIRATQDVDLAIGPSYEKSVKLQGLLGVFFLGSFGLLIMDYGLKALP